jgi:putative MATE family efflux protein
MEAVMLEPKQNALDHINWWEVVKQALRGHAIAPTEGSIARAIVLLAVPMVLEMMMESLFAVVDIFFVSRLGPTAVAAVGLTESMLTMIYTVAAGLSIGVTAVVARRMGERDPEAAAEAAMQAILLGAGIAVVMGLVLGLNAPTLLRVMGAEPDVIAVGSTFSRLMLGGSGVILMLFLINAAFRGAADAVIAMRVLWLANAINIVLCPLLIYGVGPFPELGVTGSAVATTTGRSIGVLLQLIVLFGGFAKLKVGWQHVRVKLDVMGRLLRLSASATFQVFISTASWSARARLIDVRQ